MGITTFDNICMFKVNKNSIDEKKVLDTMCIFSRHTVASVG